jgi:hypothetical protein
MRAQEPHERKLILLLVLLSHCGLIFVLSRPNTNRELGRPMPHGPLIVFLMESVKAKSGSTPDKASAPAKTRTVLKRPSTAPLINLPQQSDSDVSSSNAITDWYAEADRVAEAIVEKERSKGARRAFEHKMPSAEEREKPSIFDPEPVRRAGTWDGPSRFYVTDNCYYEYDRAPRPPPTALDTRLKTPVCKPPPKGGGDAMFKDLMPDYLKPSPSTSGHPAPSP